MPKFKYHNKPVITATGEKFDSSGEYARWNDLQLLERAGEIRGLKRQIKFEIGVNPISGRKLYWTPDFIYEEKTVHGWALVVEDYKGFMVRDIPLRAALFQIRYPQYAIRIYGPPKKKRRG